MVERDASEVSYRSGRRRAVRVLVPVAVAAVAATGIGLVPALASDAAPSLPSVTAEQLVAKVLGSDATAFSGTVKVQADLGVPSQLLGAASGGRGEGGAADPQAKALELLGGEHTLQVAVDGPERQRVGLLDTLSGFTVVHNGSQLWAWDSRTDQVLHLTDQHPGAERSTPLAGGLPTPQEAAKEVLSRSAGTSSVTVAGTASVAGRGAYVLSVKPTQQGSTIAEVRISVDAQHGLPLGVQVRGTDGGQVLDAHFSDISFAVPAARTFEFTAPKGAKVTEPQREPGAEKARPEAGAAAGVRPSVVGQDWTAVLSTVLPKGQAPVAQHGGALPRDPLALVKSLGKPVGGGTLISSKVLNVLVTDDGRVFAGAVTLPVLQSAAGVK